MTTELIGLSKNLLLRKNTPFNAGSTNIQEFMERLNKLENKYESDKSKELSKVNIDGYDLTGKTSTFVQLHIDEYRKEGSINAGDFT